VTDSSRTPRRYPRIASHHVVLITEPGEVERDAFARTREVGQGGCCFAIGEPPDVGSVLAVSIALADRIVETVSRVVWAREVDGRWEVGVEFAEIDPVDRAAIEALAAPADASVS